MPDDDENANADDDQNATADDDENANADDDENATADDDKNANADDDESENGDGKNDEKNGKENKDNNDVGGKAIPANPARGGELTTAVLPVPTPVRSRNTPAQGSVVPTAASVAPTPTRERNRVSGTPARGGEPITAVLPIPTTIGGDAPARGSVVSDAASTIPATASVLTPAPSIGKDSGTSTADLGSSGEGALDFLFFLSLFIFNLVPCTPQMGPLPDNGIQILFILTSYFNFWLDVVMISPTRGHPIALQGASRTTGGIFRGKALGNHLNHADFEHDDPDAIMLIKPKLTFKVFVYVEYGDVLAMSRVPDFDSQIPITVFFLSDTSPFAQPLLKKAAQYHDSISRKLFLFLVIIYLLNYLL
jgi:hypothetical protein